MPFDGSGNFSRLRNWVADATASIKIRADLHDTEDDGFAQGLSLTICKDGRSQITADIPWNGKKITNLGAPVAATDAATKGYADSVRTFNTPLIVSGSDANGRIRFTGLTGTPPAASVPLGLEFTQIGGFFGTKPVDVPTAGTSVNRWVWNDQADGLGTDVASLTKTGALSLGSVAATGNISAAGSVTVGASGLTTSDTIMRIGTNAAAQSILLRPNGIGSTTAQVQITTTAINATAQDASFKSLTVTAAVNGATGVFSGALSGSTITCGVGGGFQSADTNLRLGPGAAGQLLLQPNGMGTTSQQIVISGTAVSAANQDFTVKSVSASVSIGAVSGAFTGTVTVGALTSTGAVSGSNFTHGVGGGFTSADGTLRLGTGAAAGSVIVRPDGLASSTSQIVITNTAISAANQDATFKSVTATSPSSFGTLTCSVLNGTTNNAGTFSATAASAGSQAYNTGAMYMSNNSASFSFLRFYTTTAPNLNGSVSVSGTTTSYNTTSDGDLKDEIGAYDPATAIGIIRADPVLAFTWKDTGVPGIGWFAQKSYAVDPALATPPAYGEGDNPDAAPGEPGYIPWGMDYGRRTPYLWAALAWALDQIDSLTTRVTTLEGGSAA